MPDAAHTRPRVRAVSDAPRRPRTGPPPAGGRTRLRSKEPRTSLRASAHLCLSVSSVVKSGLRRNSLSFRDTWPRDSLEPQSSQSPQRCGTTDVVARVSASVSLCVLCGQIRAVEKQRVLPGHGPRDSLNHRVTEVRNHGRRCARQRICVSLCPLWSNPGCGEQRVFPGHGAEGLFEPQSSQRCGNLAGGGDPSVGLRSQGIPSPAPATVRPSFARWATEGKPTDRRSDHPARAALPPGGGGVMLKGEKMT